VAKKPPESVDAFLESLEHPLKPEILAVRQIILGADPAIGEGIKWNAPSFRTTEWFATFHLRGGFQVILHLGAKARDTTGIKLESPLLKWLGKDRASVTFPNMEVIEAKKGAFDDLVRRWIEYA
jgi:hypothetical protein